MTTSLARRLLNCKLELIVLHMVMLKGLLSYVLIDNAFNIFLHFYAVVLNLCPLESLLSYCCDFSCAVLFWTSSVGLSLLMQFIVWWKFYNDLYAKWMLIYTQAIQKSCIAVSELKARQKNAAIFFSKYAERNMAKYAAKICGNRLRLHILC